TRLAASSPSSCLRRAAQPSITSTRSFPFQSCAPQMPLPAQFEGARPMSAHALSNLACRCFTLALVALVHPAIGFGADAALTPIRTYIGTYTRADGSQGIYQAELNPADGALK